MATKRRCINAHPRQGLSREFHAVIIPDRKNNAGDSVRPEPANKRAIHDTILGAERRGRTTARLIDAAIIKEPTYGCDCRLANGEYNLFFIGARWHARTGSGE
jgi:hypothetical protein